MSIRLRIAETPSSIHFEPQKRALEIYNPTPNVTFVLTDTKTIVCTTLQTFLIRHDHRNHIRQLENLREMIRRNEVKSMSDLIDYCGINNSVYRDQMYGLELIPTKLGRHI